jgi:hypothetical protein
MEETGEEGHLSTNSLREELCLDSLFFIDFCSESIEISRAFTITFLLYVMNFPM